MAFEITSPNTGASISAQATASQLYQKTLEVYEQTSDFWQQFEGTGRDALIRVNSDVSKGAGQTINIRSLAGFYYEPTEGDSLFEANTDFENFVMQDYQLKVDYIRWATRMTERSEEFMGLRGELKAGIPREAGKWLGRMKSERMFMTMRERCGSDNQIVAGGKVVAPKTHTSTLLSADTLSYDEIIAACTRLKSLGGEPAVVKTQDKNTVKGFVVVGCTDALFSLETDSTWVSNLRSGGQRGAGNLLFSGGYTDVRGNVVVEYNPTDHDGRGAIGSPLNPKAYAGNTFNVTASGTTGVSPGGGGTSDNTIYGGGSLAAGGTLAQTTATAAEAAKRLYFKWFDGFNYQLSVGDTLGADAGPWYALCINPPTGTEANKVAFIRYTTNDGKTLTCTGGATKGDDGIGGLGTIGIDASSGTKWFDVPCTEDGVPFADTLFLAKGAAVRGYGKHRNKRGEDSREDGFINDVFIRSVFGQSLREDAAGKKPGVVRLRHAINYPGLTLPSITAYGTSVLTASAAS